MRVTSTQKLPDRPAERAAKPRMSAVTTTMPVAAEEEVLHRQRQHLGEVSSSPPHRCSPASSCLVTKLTAVRMPSRG